MKRKSKTYGCINSDSAEHIADLLRYVENQCVIIDGFIKEKHLSGPWQFRTLYDALNHQLKPTDHIIAPSISSIASSPQELLEILVLVVQQKISIYFIQENQVISKKSKVADLLGFIKNLDHIFTLKQDKKLGRPKGSLNRELKLDCHHALIQKYINIGISQASIARLIKCNPMTLHNYIRTRNIKPRQQKSSLESRCIIHTG